MRFKFKRAIASLVVALMTTLFIPITPAHAGSSSNGSTSGENGTVHGGGQYSWGVNNSWKTKARTLRFKVVSLLF